MRRERRWKLVALLAVGMAIGVIIAGTPVSAHVANWTHNWNTHIKPRADARYYTKAQSNARYYTKAQANARFLPGGNAPSGTTIRGVYRVASNAVGAASNLGSSAITFGFTLSSAPTPHFIAQGTSPPAECPGSAATPQAAAGHLCVYEGTDVNAMGQVIVNPITNGGPEASPYGAAVHAQPEGDGIWVTGGTWAVTAP